MYAANHYVRVKGRVYVAGEILPDGLEEEKIKWLMEKGAIRYIAPSAPPAPPVQSIEFPGTTAEFEPSDEEAPEASAEEDEEPEASAEEDEEPEISAEEEEKPEYIVEDAPEINVMEGVVAPESEPEKKPKRGRSTKGGGTK